MKAYFPHYFPLPRNACNGGKHSIADTKELFLFKLQDGYLGRYHQPIKPELLFQAIHKSSHHLLNFITTHLDLVCILIKMKNNSSVN